MTILVTYASRHGSTQEIGERIARKLRELGHYVDVRPIATVSNPEGYEAFVVGGAAYYFHWMKDATRFIQHHQAIVSRRPVWLFSSGPLGAEAADAQGRDVRAMAEPREFAAIRSAIHPRDARVFFGALDHRKLAFPLRLIAERLPEGDFREWSEIDAWAESIAHDLTPVAAVAGQALGSK